MATGRETPIKISIANKKRRGDCYSSITRRTTKFANQTRRRRLRQRQLGEDKNVDEWVSDATK